MTNERDAKSVGDTLRRIVGGDEDRNEADAGSAKTPGGHAQEKVEDRPSVSTVTPKDYPEGERGGTL